MLLEMALGGALTVLLILGWKWISHKYPIVQTAKSDTQVIVAAIEAELARLHEEMADFTGSLEGEMGKAYGSVVAEVSFLNKSLHGLLQKASGMEASAVAEVKTEEKTAIDGVAQTLVSAGQKLETK